MARRKDRGWALRTDSPQELSRVRSPFSPHRAFVVQFRSIDPASGGRAEHMSTGDVTLFEGQNGLFEFFSRVLRATERDPDGKH